MQHLMHKWWLLIASAGLMASCQKGPAEAIPGQELPQWKEGWLDIHSINGARGEAFWYIFPDGTTLLVDAGGELPRERVAVERYCLASKPSPDISCGAVVADYIEHFNPAAAKGGIDYMMISHYHADHFGLLPENPDSAGVPIPVHPEGGFREVSVTEVGSRLPVGMVIDRGDPENHPSRTTVTKAHERRYRNYQQYLAWTAAANGTVHETFAVGRDNQVVLRHHPGKYDCSLFGLAGGGKFWTGEGNQVDSTWFPPKEEILQYNVSENVYSLAFHLRYGKFDWFAAGDLMYKRRDQQAWQDAEAPVARVMGKVEAMKMCHHATKEAGSKELLGVLQPDVAVAGVRNDIQPDVKTVRRLFKASPDVQFFCTNLDPRCDSLLRENGIDPSTFACTEGHVVLRVAPGGDRYWVFVLDDTDQLYRIRSVHGPYNAQ